MRGGRHLLLLAVLLLLERCQPKLQVLMSPHLEQVFSGDLFYLKCNDSTNGSPVNWYLNGIQQSTMTTRYKVAVASQSHSGQYHCESDGEKSDSYGVQVREYEPSASLIIKTGQPVMQTGGSVILSLEHHEGLQGWICSVYRGDKVNVIKLRNINETSLDFQPKRLEVPETTFWCHHSGKKLRSNQVTVRTSEKQVSLEMFPLLPVAGESLTLRCLTWGTDLISRAVFYKDNKALSDSSKDVINIRSVTAKDAGSYKCYAKFTYIAKPAGPPYEVESDAQDVLVQERTMQAVLTEGMHCSCDRCPGDTHSHWYIKRGQSWEYMTSTPSYLTPDSGGTYACRRVWGVGRSSMSNAVDYESQEPGIPVTIIVLILLLLIALVVVVGIFIWRKNRSATGAIYEDVALRSRDKLGEKGDPEYDTLDPEAPNRKRGEKEGEYEPLKKEEMKGGEYQTLGMEHAAGGEGGYEVLKKEGRKEGEYQTLGAEGAGGGEGGYEALKKEGRKEGEYHTLGAEGAGGGHEAVGKDNTDKEYEIVDEKK